MPDTAFARRPNTACLVLESMTARHRSAIKEPWRRLSVVEPYFLGVELAISAAHSLSDKS